MPNEILKTIADNPALLAALRELLEKQFAPPVDLTDLDASTTDVALGQFLRARIAGMNAIKDAFKEIERWKSVPAKEQSPNPAR